jgi:hypothetical protein
VTGGQLTREEIMRVCGIAQWRRNTTLYKTEAALKARLGVS